MADYINSNILCQSYIHVEPENLSDEEVHIIIKKLEVFVSERAAFFLYPDVNVDIKSKEGSLILYATVAGTMTMLYNFVKDYPSFREGAIQLYEDARMLAESINTESLFVSKAKHRQVIRVEARTGVIGSIRNIIMFFDSVKSKEGIVPVSSLTIELEEAERSIDRLLAVMNSEEDIKTIKEGFLEMVIDLPETLKPQKDKEHKKGELEAYKRKVNDLLAKLS